MVPIRKIHVSIMATTTGSTIRIRHQVAAQAVRHHQVVLLHQVLLRHHQVVQATQTVATRNAKYGKIDGETAQLATRTEKGIAVIVMG